MTKCVQQLEHCKLYITLREKDLLTEEEAKGMFKLLTGKDSNRYLINHVYGFSIVSLEESAEDVIKEWHRSLE